jgi:hypothetical protein
MPTLRELQTRFQRLVTAPVPVAEALAAAGLERADVEAWFLGDERLDAVARLDIYGHMYFFRLRDVLAEIYPRTAALLGADRFHDLIVDYLIACPPAHPSIDRAGARLPGFLAGAAVVAERPWLADLAAVEWAAQVAHDGPDAAPLAPAELAAVAPDDLGDLRLGLVPTFTLHRSTHDLAAILDGADDPPAPTPTTIAVWRPAYAVKRRAVPALEARLLEGLAHGMTVAELCEDIAAAVGEEGAAAAAFAHLSRWCGEGMLVRA